MDSDSLLRLVKGSGLDAEFEVHYSELKATTLEVEKNVLKRFSVRRIETAVVRCLRAGKLGVVRFSPPPKELRSMLEHAYHLTAAAGSSDAQTHFADKPLKSRVDSSVASMMETDAGEVAKRVLEAVKTYTGEPLIHSINAEAGYGYRRVVGANTNGVSGEWLGCFANFSAEVSSKRGEDQASASKSHEASDLGALRFEDTIGEAVKLSRGMLGAASTSTFTGTVVLSPEATGALLSSVVEALSGIEILKGRSFMAGKKAMQVASPLLRMREEVRVDGSPYNRGFDDELIETATKPIIEGGELKTYIHNIYSAEKMGEAPTGNGFIGPQDLGVGTTNIVVDAGKGAVDELISHVRRGIYLIRAGDRPNPASGDLSAMVSAGYYVEDGSIKHPLKETMIGVNILDLLRSIVEVGGERVMLWGYLTPPIVVDGVKISGRA